MKGHEAAGMLALRALVAAAGAGLARVVVAFVDAWANVRLDESAGVVGHPYGDAAITLAGALALFAPLAFAFATPRRRLLGGCVACAFLAWGAPAQIAWDGGRHVPVVIDTFLVGLPVEPAPLPPPLFARRAPEAYLVELELFALFGLAGGAALAAAVDWRRAWLLAPTFAAAAAAEYLLYLRGPEGWMTDAGIGASAAVLAAGVLAATIAALQAAAGWPVSDRRTSTRAGAPRL